jgi:hypothetical protein
VENHFTVAFVVVAAVVLGADLRLEDCRLLVLLEAVAEVMGMSVEVRGENHMLKAPQQMLLRMISLGRDNNSLSPSFFHFSVLLQTVFSPSLTLSLWLS